MTNRDSAIEVNFDGLIGPTHNYSGLAPGNLASQTHRSETSFPRAAARQGLAKMRRLMSLGVPQAVLPPHPRPNLDLLRRLGFEGDAATILQRAQSKAPHLLAAAMSGSSMWTANAATVCPSADAADGRVHFTPANLVASLHRASETKVTANILRHVFHDDRFFAHHRPLPASADMGDEGAANHTRFCHSLNDPGVQLFVYGLDRQSNSNSDSGPHRFRPRQSEDASRAIARLHQLRPDRVVFAKQSSQAIDAGVFHNDVIAVGHRELLFCHQQAFSDSSRVYEALRVATSGRIQILEVASSQVPLDDAVQTYLFNSQIVTSADGHTVLVAPDECRNHQGVRSLLDDLVGQNAFDSVEFVDIRQSMNNGGGPACLRLRVVLTGEQLASIEQGVFLTDALAAELERWVDRHYRESLTADDLADPQLMRESRDALDQLSGILRLGAIYDFQQ